MEIPWLDIGCGVLALILLIAYGYTGRRSRDRAVSDQVWVPAATPTLLGEPLRDERGRTIDSHYVMQRRAPDGRWIYREATEEEVFEIISERGGI